MGVRSSMNYQNWLGHHWAHVSIPSTQLWAQWGNHPSSWATRQYKAWVADCHIICILYIQWLSRLLHMCHAMIPFTADMPLYLYIISHAYTYTHTHTYIRTYVRTYIHTSMHTYIHTYIYIYIYILVFTCIYYIYIDGQTLRTSFGKNIF